MGKKRIILVSVAVVLLGMLGLSPCMAKTHTMEKGDTLWDLSSKFYGDPTLYPVFLEVNGIANPRTIPTGKVIIVPSLEEIKGISKEHDSTKRADMISKITGNTSSSSSNSGSNSNTDPLSKPLFGGNSGTNSGANAGKSSFGSGMSLEGILEGPKVKAGQLKHAENVKRQ